MHTLDDLIENAAASGGSERANYQLFVVGLCEALGLPKPEMAREENRLNDYVFERRVDFKHGDGTRTAGFLDCYKRDCFVLEAKQSAKRTAKATRDQLDMLGEEDRQRKLGHARRGGAGWDKVMRAARKQAEDYARALPVEHGYPPFLLIVDVGHVIEVYADFSGQGKNYAHFPDRQGYRISLDDLRDDDIQARLKAIWTDPHSLDPARESARVTRDIAGRLARIARNLEGKHDARDVAEFLMRCLFTMFAEDVDLLPRNMFADLLAQLSDDPRSFVPALENLWKTMDEGGFEPRTMADLKRFNGSLFKSRRALPLAPEDINELYVAARQDWRDVEPAIFGTLLERALDPMERSRLGAHYTPRAYVERLVVPTIIEPLRADWAEVQARIRELHDDRKDDEALALAKEFHHTLCTVRILDPACGTGNFLYVSLELLKKLEGEVLEAIEALGEDQKSLMMRGETVNPEQFYGLELNPRAVPIADLVLWIGYLKWQLRTAGPNSITEPVLRAYGTIKHQDAILAYEAEELVRDASGAPVTRWDGITRMAHPITGEMVPDASATREQYSYRNARPADWPEAEFIVGNPPFIGGKDMRTELGDGYAEAVWKARPHIPGGADFVMHFWDEAARRLTRKGKNPLRRFGFITTNSITQTFSRRVIEKYLVAKTPLSLVFAVPDHPWLKAADKAAVRIAMTVAVRGEREGVLAEVVAEKDLNSDAPTIELAKRKGKMRANLVVGANLSSADRLLANEGLSSRGVSLHGAGFIVTPEKARSLGLGSVPGLENHILDYRNGRDIAQRPRGVMVIDLYPLDAGETQQRFPAVYQYLAHAVRPEREAKVGASKDMADYAARWWQFGKVRSELRPVLADLPRYIATIETAKHRFFEFLDASIRPDNRLVNIGVEGADALSVLSSRPHVCWTLALGGQLEDRPIYTKTHTFDPFPFPDLTNKPDIEARLTELGERLDSFRKERLAAHTHLTMTGLYNVLERVRALEWAAGPGRNLAAADDEEDADDPIPPLTDKERDIYEAGLIGILKQIHDDIDRLVFAAYGWEDLADRLVGLPGATTPSPHKTEDQQAAEEELLTRLVALNQERAAQEARGIVRWLRPDYQLPKLGHKVAAPQGEQAEADLVIAAKDDKPKWPSDGLAQIREVVDILHQAPAPVLPDAVSKAFAGRNTPKRKQRVEAVLATLVETGSARTGELDGQTRYFVPR